MRIKDQLHQAYDLTEEKILRQCKKCTYTSYQRKDKKSYSWGCDHCGAKWYPRSETVFKRSSLTKSQWETLITLMLTYPQSKRKMAKALGIDRVTVTNSVKRIGPLLVKEILDYG